MNRKDTTSGKKENTVCFCVYVCVCLNRNIFYCFYLSLLTHGIQGVPQNANKNQVSSLAENVFNLYLSKEIFSLIMWCDYILQWKWIFSLSLTHTKTPLCSGVGGCGSPPRYHQLNTILLFMSFSFILIHLKKSKKPHLCWSIVAKPCTNMFNF